MPANKKCVNFDTCIKVWFFTVENTPQCRTNLCIEEARDLLCPVGSTIHVTRMKCGPDDDQRCPWNLNYIIYPTCEGKQQCGASGLRILGLDNVCRNRSFVLVDYICVQSKFDSDDLVYYENSKELSIIV